MADRAVEAEKLSRGFGRLLLIGGLGLIAIGVDGRRIVSMASDQRVTGELPDTPIGPD
ncbi:hypothetical protein [Streptomyces sp. NPDC002785]|uniref:hypothetical protein n=1 Tax=Streptomyces sp. NPDC002785 TaxID=3154543 RepID=UPI0033338C64